MLEVGIRVIRGPDWRWGAQDNGDGHVGTVVEIGKSGSLITPEKTVVVQWDYGYRTNYRVGYQDSYDLLVVDNAPAGVKHPNIICDECQKLGIAGMRWKCINCYDYDLCTQCYMADKHDINHVFQRFITSSSEGVEMTRRKHEAKVPIKGIFVGAKVVRGVDWDWGDQDGGEGKTGRVVDIRGWDNESSRSVANVKWTSGSTNVYRVGHKGTVDLKYTQETCGGNYYFMHLPCLGHTEDAERSQIASNHLTFNVGDKIKVVMNIAALKAMQDGHGGWNQKMADYIGQIGTVHRVTDKGDIRVQYEGCSHRWTFHPAALTKVNTFAVGDIVRVLSELERVKDRQKGHGEWIDFMTNILGKMGKVSKIYSDGDLRVTVEGQTWTLNPLSVQLVPGSATELDNTLQTDEEKRPNPVDSLLPNVVEEQANTSDIDHLVHEAAEGNYVFVRDFLTKYPNKINGKSSGRTSLQVAVHQGHLDIVHRLLTAGADVEIKDEVEDTALHYASFGNQPLAMELLLLKNANVNAENTNKCSSLHIAVNKQHVMCVRVLLKYHCNVNIQDSYGDTALHDAIGKDDTEIIDLLFAAPEVDFTLRNKRGFNVVHYAALKGNNYAAEKLLARTRQLVDVKKDDGFAAIHLAVLNGHRAVTETLLVQGQGDINLRNNRRQTALLLAIAQSHCGVIELLVKKGANANIPDEDGGTALHLAVLKAITSPPLELPSEIEAPTIHKIYTQLQLQNPRLPNGLAIACFLIQEAGADLSKNNIRLKTPIDVIPLHVPEYQDICDVLNTYDKEAKRRQIKRPPPGPGPLPEQDSPSIKVGNLENSTPPSSENAECTVCSEKGKNIVFEPCGDKIACAVCAIRMKRCLLCHQTIVRKINKDGCDISCKERQSSAERLKYLESKIAEIEETHCCSICMERRRSVAFLCGHGACESCARTLKTCHMCRKTISRKINLY